MDRCPITFETLLDYHEGRTDEETTRRLEQHLDTGCAACREQLTWLKRFLPALQRAVIETEPTPSPHAVDYARGLLRAQTTAPPQLSLPVRIAQLLFDSRTRAVPAAARGEDLRTVQRLYSTDDHYLELWEERAGDGRSYLIGQVMPLGGGDPIRPETATLTAIDGTVLAAAFEADEVHLSAVPAGVYQLRIGLQNLFILVPEIVVGPGD